MLERLAGNPIADPMKFLIPLICALFVACNKAPSQLDYEIISKRPHDPECYTQGLEFSGKRLLESGGQYGESTVREIDPKTGEILRKRPIAKSMFAEGITVLNNELWVLSWKENTALVLDPESFKYLRRHKYKGEGWGLTNDGKLLIMSDGSSTIKFLDPSDFSLKRSIEVTDGNSSLSDINELELVDGQIFANIYRTGKIARIDPETGKVTGWLDLSALRNQLPRPNQAEAFNGIARDPATGHLLVTGKRWPLLFEIKVSEK